MLTLSLLGLAAVFSHNERHDVIMGMSTLTQHTKNIHEKHKCMFSNNRNQNMIKIFFCLFETLIRSSIMYKHNTIIDSLFFDSDKKL